MSLFKKYDYWFKSGKYTAIQKVSTLLMGIISFMLLARILGPATYGVWALFLTISGIIETARIALIKNAFIRFMNQENNRVEQGGLQGASFLISLGISIVLAIIFLLFAPNVSNWLKAPDLKQMLQWYALIILISTLFTHFEMLLNAKMDFRGLCYMYCIRQGLLLIMLFAYYWSDYPITMQLLAILYFISVVVGAFIGFMFCRPYLIWEFSHYRNWLFKLWNYGKFVFVTNVSALLFRSTDSFLTSNVFGTTVSAYYNAGLRIGNLVDLPSQVLGDVLFPKAAQFNSSDKASVRHMYERTVGAILIFSIPALIILLLFPATILHILAGEKFVEGASVLRITALFGFILPFIKQFGTIMDATGHPQTNCRVMIVAFFINIITNFIGIYFFGVVGAAVGTLITYCILIIITQRILNKKFGIKLSNVFNNTYLLCVELIDHFQSFYKKAKAK